jgi:hypothetical protein
VKLTDALLDAVEIPRARRTDRNPNAAVCGWCTRCKEWAVRGRRNECMFCDKPLLDEPGGERL